MATTMDAGPVQVGVAVADAERHQHRIMDADAVSVTVAVEGATLKAGVLMDAGPVAVGTEVREAFVGQVGMVMAAAPVAVDVDVRRDDGTEIPAPRTDLPLALLASAGDEPTEIPVTPRGTRADEPWRIAGERGYGGEASRPGSLSDRTRSVQTPLMSRSEMDDVLSVLRTPGRVWAVGWVVGGLARVVVRRIRQRQERTMDAVALEFELLRDRVTLGPTPLELEDGTLLELEDGTLLGVGDDVVLGL